jgi:hypothetical protein
MTFMPLRKVISRVSGAAVAGGTAPMAVARNKTSARHVGMSGIRLGMVEGYNPMI